jgi:hypothetical protein
MAAGNFCSVQFARIHNPEMTLLNSSRMRWLKLIIIARSRRAAMHASD